MNNYIVENCRIILPHEIIHNKSVVVVNGIIEQITAHTSQYADFKRIDAQENLLTAGLVETHIHGCEHYPVESDDLNGIEKVAKALSRRGINYFNATILCNETSICNIANELERKPELKKYVHGMYIEGPFINPQKKGGILPHLIRPADADYLKYLIDLGKGHIRMMTIAPELRGIELMVKILIENNIIPALGHSNCTTAQAQNLLKQFSNKFNITHLFNAMSPILHRESGLAMLPFVNREVFFELNSDGVHVANNVVDMCYNHLNTNKFVLITDAVNGAGLPYGTFRYNKMDVISDEKGIRYAENGIMCGSNCLMDENIRRFIHLSGAKAEDAIRLATLNPCSLLGVENQRGSIEVGKIADMVIFDQNFTMIQNLYADNE